MSRTWTEHKLTDSMLKQLAAASNRENGSLYPGIGYGAPSSRAALFVRGLANNAAGECKAYPGHRDDRINDTGRKALEDTRMFGTYGCATDCKCDRCKELRKQADEERLAQTRKGVPK